MAEHIKKCRDCGKEKPMDEFSKHSKMADGHLNSCKECRKAYLRKYNKNPEAKKKKRRHYLKNWEKYQENSVKYQQENKEKYAEYRREYMREYHKRKKDN